MKRTKQEIEEANLCLHLMFPNLSTNLQYRFRNAIQTINGAIDEIEEIKDEPMNQQIEDQIVLRVLSRFSERSQVGITKYNTTLERTDLSTLEWLTHAQEEAMDFVLYLERLKDEYRGGLLTKMVKQSEEDGLYEDKLKRTMPK
jgi:GTPase SAR1 family protein